MEKEGYLVEEKERMERERRLLAIAVAVEREEAMSKKKGF